MDYQAIIKLVKEASQIVFDKSLKADVAMKGEADFVTAVDLKISSFVKERLAILDPEAGFMSEEEVGEIPAKRWILDPIDGTTNLVYDYNMSSVSLAYCENGQILFGVVYNPYNGDLFTAERGKGAYLNGERLGVAPDRDLKNCLIEFGAGSTKKQYTEETFRLGKAVFKECLDLRRICSSALAICYVAAGRLNGYFERSIKPWDYAAATLVLEECGGKSLDWTGAPVQFEKASSFVCGTPKALSFLLKTIQENADV
jgi:myo-inositol-1(or 4)-monophosphatase